MNYSSKPPHEKNNILHMQKQRRRSAVTAKLISAFVFATGIVQFLYCLDPTAKLISAFVFATRIAQFLYFLDPKFPASSPHLCPYSSVCIGLDVPQKCWFSHAAAQMPINTHVVFQRNKNIFPAKVIKHTQKA